MILMSFLIFLCVRIDLRQEARVGGELRIMFQALQFQFYGIQKGQRIHEGRLGEAKVPWPPAFKIDSWSPHPDNQKNQSIHFYLHWILGVWNAMPTLRVRSWSSLNIFQDEDGAALSAFPEDNGKGVLLR